MDNLATFWNTALVERNWSWALLCIAYMIVFMMMRNFFFHSLVRRAKALNSKWFQEIKKTYLKKCAAGWVLFLVSLLLLVFFWVSADFQKITLYEAAMLALVLFAALLSIMSHLITFNTATLCVLKQLENNQMTF